MVDDVDRLHNLLKRGINVNSRFVSVMCYYHNYVIPNCYAYSYVCMHAYL